MGYVAGYNNLLEWLKQAINLFEAELEEQDYMSADELHAVVLNEMSMTEKEYRMIMGRKYDW